MALFVCRTCPRYDSAATGTFCHALRAAFERNAGTAPGDVRYVQCLGGCPDDGVAAVDGPGKARVRFTGLTADDADVLAEAARAHDACLTGAPGDWEIPAALQDRISSITLKRRPTGPPGD
ncbi:MULTISPECIES: DUF1636 family protein [Amycolatopsis]|uniref:Predicted metal-binding protein n=2 Tax=Amycolatopsis TaxID=1813 RepID=A0A1I3WNG1_9PSEU|nr:DUF1636 family protein [Amycolatopsis sacchari]SFK09015.1 Predicted metal-binding protein [Amycolatopsis sacchari]